MRIIFFFVLALFGADLKQAGKPELICTKVNKSRNICYYNFRIDGKKYHFTDTGCRYTKDKALEKIAEGTIALGKDWKVPC